MVISIPFLLLDVRRSAGIPQGPQLGPIQSLQQNTLKNLIATKLLYCGTGNSLRGL